MITKCSPRPCGRPTMWTLTSRTLRHAMYWLLVLITACSHLAHFEATPIILDPKAAVPTAPSTNFSAAPRFDKCTNKVKFFITGTCGHAKDNPLGDNRYDASESSQCRVGCDQFTHASYHVFPISSDCNFCQSAEAQDFAVKYEQNWTQLCIPRGLCIEKCGKERPGCVYTGSCGSQICLQGAESGKAAERERITFAGPGSYFKVDNTVEGESGVLIPTSSTAPASLPKSVRTHEHCQQLNVSFPLSSKCGAYDRPFGDDRMDSAGRSAQCRTICEDFDIKEHEVVNVHTNCSFCGSEEAAKFVSVDNGTGSVHICIPRERCVSACGPEKPGCVYTGSCGSQICLSGLDSKKPASIVMNDDGSNSTASCDNTGTSGSVDPPVFARSPDVNPTPPPSTSPTPSPANPAKPGPSIWRWLGPVIGAIAVLITAFIGACATLKAGKLKSRETSPGRSASDSSSMGSGAQPQDGGAEEDEGEDGGRANENDVTVVKCRCTPSVCAAMCAAIATAARFT